MYHFLVRKYISFFEQQVFGICSWMGDKIGIRASTIRLYFVYLSFFTFGSPIVIYLALAFLREHRDAFLPRNFRTQRRIWDL